MVLLSVFRFMAYLSVVLNLGIVFLNSTDVFEQNVTTQGHLGLFVLLLVAVFIFKTAQCIQGTQHQANDAAAMELCVAPSALGSPYCSVCPAF